MQLPRCCVGNFYELELALVSYMPLANFLPAFFRVRARLAHRVRGERSRSSRCQHLCFEDPRPHVCDHEIKVCLEKNRSIQ